MFWLYTVFVCERCNESSIDERSTGLVVRRKGHDNNKKMPFSGEYFLQECVYDRSFFFNLSDPSDDRRVKSSFSQIQSEVFQLEGLFSNSICPERWKKKKLADSISSENGQMTLVQTRSWRMVTLTNLFKKVIHSSPTKAVNSQITISF